jgi:hypothetical protein
LGFGRVLPEVRVFGPGVQIGEALLGGLDVKETSSAALMTARSLRRWFGFRRAW